jgi:hypothetical protein
MNQLSTGPSQSWQGSQSRSNPFFRGGNPFRGHDYPWDEGLDAVELLKSLGAQRVRLQSNGEVICCCPLPGHGDRNPSFSMNTRKTGHPAHCWSCGWEGNPITLIEEVFDLHRGAARSHLTRFGAKFRESAAYVPSRNNFRGAGRKPRGDNFFVQIRVVRRIVERERLTRADLPKRIMEELGLKKSRVYEIIKKMRTKNFLNLNEECFWESGRSEKEGKEEELNNEPYISSPSIEKSECHAYSGSPKPNPLSGTERPENVTLICACGCNRQLSGRSDKRHFEPSCRKRAQRARIRAMTPEPEFKYNHNESATENLARYFPSMFGKEVMEAKKRRQENLKRQSEIFRELRRRQHIKELHGWKDANDAEEFIKDARGFVYQLKWRSVCAAYGIHGSSDEALREELAALEREEVLV